ncbi:MAG: diguanylate cyclase [Bacteroidota bacterium]
MRVLIGMKDAVARLALHTLLQQWGHEVAATGSGDEVWQHCSGPQPPWLALLDWQLPGPDGATLCRRLRDRADAPYVYVLLMGESAELGDGAAALEAGADDFIQSPLDQNALRLRLRTAEHILLLQRNLLQSRQALEYRATHDSLTGIWNRAEVLGLLEREIARAQREGTAVSIIMIDVDHFKQVNDQRGHDGGDEALREVAQRLSDCVRPYDGLGRYGGEEFLIVLSGCSGGNAAGLAERLRQSVAEPPLSIYGEELRLSISLGVAVWSADHGDMQALIRAADAALYRAKKAGRNQVEVAWDDSRLRMGVHPATDKVA